MFNPNSLASLSNCFSCFNLSLYFNLDLPSLNSSTGNKSNTIKSILDLSISSELTIDVVSLKFSPFDILSIFFLTSSPLK